MNVLKKAYKKIFQPSKKQYTGPEKFPPGHYYSLIPDVTQIKKYHESIFDIPDLVSGVDLNMKVQIEYSEKFARHIGSKLYYESNTDVRYNPENDSFSYDDGPILHYFLREIQPNNVIEIGSGFSSALMIDTSEKFLNNKVGFTFIDINCERLKSNLKTSDSKEIEIIESPVQDINLDFFKKLNSGDLLFIDSSHVSKVSSDLNYILFKIIPTLKSGVFIHFHDIRYPFEYRPSMIYNKVYWNEAYLLRAFLSYNADFEIIFWLNCLLNNEATKSKELFKSLPLNEWARRFNNNVLDYSDAGGSIYIRKK